MSIARNGNMTKEDMLRLIEEKNREAGELWSLMFISDLAPGHVERPIALVPNELTFLNSL